MTPVILALSVWAIIGVAVYITTFKLVDDERVWKLIFSNLAFSCYNMLVVVILLVGRLIHVI